jgi:prepilin-type N-terminal cleavage/methylation domain-containing protein
MRLIRPIKEVRSSQRAFTFIEVMVGTAIMLVMFTSLFAGLTMGLSITQLSRENLRATQIMLDKLEGVRLYSWDQLTNTTILKSSFTNYFFETNNIETTLAQGNGITYTGRVEVGTTPFSTSYSGNCRKITVSVGWVSGNVVRKRSMVTLYSQKGLQNYIYSN